MLSTLSLGLVLAVQPRWDYENAYDNVADGAWYMGQHNEDAVLAWGESYVMMSLASMYRATGHPMYLDRLAQHLDAVIDQRDDNRGVTDYRGVSAACWRNVSYQPDPYCYVVHSGMLIYPMLELVRLVEAGPHGDRVAHDGMTFSDKATQYLAEAQATVAAHEDQWNPAGYYVFRPDADFLDYAGQDLPLNQSNAMGRALLVLADLTGDASHLEKATALAQRLRNQMTTAGDGSLLWNYWGGAYSGNGEDVSHASINVDFAWLAAQHGIVFTQADLDALATTFVSRVYVDDKTISDFVGGGPVNTSSYRPQVGRWLRLTGTRTAVYTAVRDLYEADYGPDSIGSGSLLLSWAHLAEYEPLHCAPFFYTVDWQDLGDTRQATAYGANILTVPPSLQDGCIIPAEVDVPRDTVVEQWDGDAYHRVAQWQPTGGLQPRFIPYERTWPFVYFEDGVLFQFSDSFVAGDGIIVGEHPGFEAPSITSTPVTTAEPGVEWSYQIQGDYEDPHWWKLVNGPADADLDPDSGLLTWTPEGEGDQEFVVALEVEYGVVEQAFAVTVETAGGDTTGGSAGSTSNSGDDESAGSTGATTGDSSDSNGDDGTTGSATDSGLTGMQRDTDTDDGCGCRTEPRGLPAWLWLAGALGLRRRKHS